VASEGPSSGGRPPDAQASTPGEGGRPAPQGGGERSARGGRALGRGLSALIGERLDERRLREEGHLRELPVDQVEVSRRQPRRVFDEEELRELAESVRNLGVVQPVLVRPAGSPGRYELVAGERRLRAARLAGLTTIPAVVRPVDEAASLEIALAENVSRQDLNAIEEAHAYAVLVDEFELTHGRIAELVGKSRVAVTNLLRLLELPDEVQEMVEDGSLSEGHGRATPSSAAWHGSCGTRVSRCGRPSLSCASWPRRPRRRRHRPRPPRSTIPTAT
jgi:ParB/RepB/Spo0J family partition protein